MDLHNLDLGLPRFLEIHLCLVLKEPIPLEPLQLKARRLVALWPILNTRMNLLRSSFVPIKGNSTDGLWRERRLSSTLDETIPSLNSPAATKTIDSVQLHNLLPSEDTFYDKLFPRAFTIRATLLKDACLLRFTVQHPLCDAKGFFHLVKTYCNLLVDRDNPLPVFKRHLEFQPENNDEKSTSLVARQQPAALRHENYFIHGWTALFAGLWKQGESRRGGPVRKDMTFLMPNTIIDKLAMAAETAGMRVTKHDLLMALIHEVAIPGSDQAKGPLTSPQFSFVMNISRFLRHAPMLHNPWVLIPMSTLQLPRDQKRSKTLYIASHIRSNITDARRPPVVRQIIEQHKDAKSTPFRPAHYGSPEPNIIVSSWTHLPLFDLEFPSSTKDKMIKPAYAQCSVNSCPLNMGGLTFDNGIFTWSSSEGFWMQGNLEERIWKRFDALRESYLRGSA